MSQLITLAAFKALNKPDSPEKEAELALYGVDKSQSYDGIIKGVLPIEKAIDVEKRTVSWVISTKDIDRDRDTIEPSGWDLKNYLKNPVILWAHSHKDFPIGKALSVDANDGTLKSTSQFATREENPMGDTVFRLIEGGYLNATSVGFDPKEWSFTEDKNRPFGIDFKQQELLEYSVVPVPSNPMALVEARSKGICIGPLKEWAEKLLDEASGPGQWLSNDELEVIYKASKEKNPVISLPPAEIEQLTNHAKQVDERISELKELVDTLGSKMPTDEVETPPKEKDLGLVRKRTIELLRLQNSKLGA